MSIADRVEAFVSNYYRRNGDSEFGDEYQQIFANEGSRKASYVLQDLKGKQDEYGFHLRDLAYLSIGGADGSEAEAVLKECDIPHAVVLEIDTPACDKARERRESLLPKKLDVFEGDAVGNLDKAIEAIKSRGAKGLIVSARGPPRPALAEFALRDVFLTEIASCSLGTCRESGSDLHLPGMVCNKLSENCAAADNLVE